MVITILSSPSRLANYQMAYGIFRIQTEPLDFELSTWKVAMYLYNPSLSTRTVRNHSGTYDELQHVSGVFQNSQANQDKHPSYVHRSCQIYALGESSGPKPCIVLYNRYWTRRPYKKPTFICLFSLKSFRSLKAF